MEKKRVIVTKYNNKYFTTEIKETFEEYIQTLKSNFLLPNEMCGTGCIVLNAF